MKFWSILIVFFLLFSQLSIVYSLEYAHALTLQVEPKMEECFHEDIPANSDVELTFTVIRGGLLDIRTKIEGPDGVIYEDLIFFNHEAADGKQDHTQAWRVNKASSYKFCFDNKMSRFTAKVVDFEIYYHSTDGAIRGDKNEPASHDDVKTIEESVKRMGQSFDHVEKELNYLRNRESRHRETAESTNSRIFWYSLLEAVLLLTVSFSQAFYLKRAFDGRRSRA